MVTGKYSHISAPYADLADGNKCSNINGNK